MKKLVYFTVHPLVFLCIIPPAVLFKISVKYTDLVEKPLGLIPMAVLCAGILLFTLAYFSRFLVFSKTEIEAVGFFSSRDKTTCQKGKKLILEKWPKGIIRVAVFGTDGEAPALAFLKDREPTEIFQMRERIYAGNGAFFAIGKLYGVPRDVMVSALTEETFRAEDCGYLLTAERQNDVRRITLEWKTEIEVKAAAAPTEKYHFRLIDKK